MIMKANKPLLILILFSGIISNGCVKQQPVIPLYEARYDHSEPVIRINIEKAMETPATFKLSQIASELEYFSAGDTKYPVKQVIAIPDSDAFITFNKPRIFYRKAGAPSKRYGLKALAYRWYDAMNDANLFYDKKTRSLYYAFSGLNKLNQDKIAPYIGTLYPLNTMISIRHFLYPDDQTAAYPLHLNNPENDKLLSFSSSGYTIYHYENEAGEPNKISTFNMQGDMICQFTLKENTPGVTRSSTKDIPSFETSYWNDAQERMNFMIPFCDTVYQLRDSQTIAPIYALDLGNMKLSDEELKGNGIPKGKAWIRALSENPNGLFIGILQKGAPHILNWRGEIDGFKPVLTHRIVYLKKEGKAYTLPSESGGFINDIDDGLPFWPDGQTDDYLYMIRAVSDMRDNLIRTGSPKQQALLKYLDSPATHEKDYVMIIAKLKK